LIWGKGKEGGRREGGREGGKQFLFEIEYECILDRFFAKRNDYRPCHGAGVSSFDHRRHVRGKAVDEEKEKGEKKENRERRDSAESRFKNKSNF